MGNPADTLIVYGILNPSDTLHSLLVYRSVSGKERGAEELLSDPALLYPTGIQVTIKLLSSSGNTLSEFSFKPETLFVPQFNAPFRLVWRARGSVPLQAAVARLTITSEDGNHNATSTIPLLTNIDIYYPSETDTSQEIDLSGKAPFSVGWEHNPLAVTYAVELTLLYREGNGSTMSDRRVSWLAHPWVDPGVENCLGNICRVTVSLGDFLGALAGNIPASDSVVREATHLLITIWAGDENYMTYRRIQQAQTFSLAAEQALPLWGNIDGALGMLAMVYSESTVPHRLSPGTIDSIACSAITRPLNFKTSAGTLCQ